MRLHRPPHHRHTCRYRPHQKDTARCGNGKRPVDPESLPYHRRGITPLQRGHGEQSREVSGWQEEHGHDRDGLHRSAIILRLPCDREIGFCERFARFCELDADLCVSSCDKTEKLQTRY